MSNKQKPFTGLHWWYRLLTGRQYTYPFIMQHELKIYWKKKKGDNVTLYPCRALNFLRYTHFKLRDIYYIFKESPTTETKLRKAMQSY